MEEGEEDEVKWEGKEVEEEKVEEKEEDVGRGKGYMNRRRKREAKED